MIYRKTLKIFVMMISISFIISSISLVHSNSVHSFNLYASRNTLGENDEGLHYSDNYNNQEWWYYNIIFNDPNSDLKNWSIIASYSIFPKLCSLKLALHDDKSHSYGGLYIHPKEAGKITGPGVNISINDSYAKGIYPEWNIYAENTGRDKTEITANLTFKANSKPIWLVANMGKNNPKSKLGYYCIMNCNASGQITINKTVYHVKGLGYHDHFWAPLTKKEKNTTYLQKPKTNQNKALDFNIWDWLCIHFDNGWGMFLGKIHSSKRTIFSNIMPGTICITPDGKNIIECFFFDVDYQETQPSSIPSINIPTKIHIKAIILRTTKPYGLFPPLFLDIYYTKNTVMECLYGSPPDWGYWETTGKVQGKIKSLIKTIDLNGWAIMETTSNIDNS